MACRLATCFQSLGTNFSMSRHANGCHPKEWKCHSFSFQEDIRMVREDLLNHLVWEPLRIYLVWMRVPDLHEQMLADLTNFPNGCFHSLGFSWCDWSKMAANLEPFLRRHLRQQLVSMIRWSPNSCIISCDTTPHVCGPLHRTIVVNNFSVSKWPTRSLWQRDVSVASDMLWHSCNCLGSLEHRLDWSALPFVDFQLWLPVQNRLHFNPCLNIRLDPEWANNFALDVCARWSR